MTDFQIVRTDTLAFPVLALSRDSSVSVHRDAERLSTCNAIAYWRTRYHEDMLIIDSNAAAYRVLSVEPVERITRLRRILLRTFNGRVRVNLELRAEGPPSLDRAKRMAEEWLDRAPYLWEAAEDLDAWKSRVVGCRSMSELIRVFD